MIFNYVVLVCEEDKDLLPYHLKSIESTHGPIENILIVDKTIEGVDHPNAARFPRLGVPVSNCNNGYDVADSYDLALSISEGWTLISHVDIKFKDSRIWEFFQEKASEGTIVGSCRDLFLINKEAYEETFPGFWPYWDIKGEKDDLGIVTVISMFDDVSEDRKVLVKGFDVGDLLIIDIKRNHFKYESIPDHVKSYFFHAIAGSGYVKDADKLLPLLLRREELKV